jgi:hypothetical protein
MAMALVLLAGANALANTVWHVSKSSSNATCTLSATTCNTINSAVSAASSLDVIVVGPGIYKESVYVDTSNLTILGAQAGKDARNRGVVSESIVDATGQGSGPGNGAGFYVDVSNVLIDGFTIQGGTSGTNASGLYVDENTPQIVNNIIQNNCIGLYLYDFDYALVARNLFRANNKGAAGANDYALVGMKGFGLASYIYYPMTFSENAFEENLAAAMWVSEVDGMATITGNTSNNDGAFLVCWDCTYSVTFNFNQGRNFGAKGFLPVYGAANADAAIDLLYDNYGVEITNNLLTGGKANGYSGIAFSTIISPVSVVCDSCTVSNNTITGFAGNGIVAEESTISSTATLELSMITANLVENNGGVGILIGAAPQNYGNTLVNNKAEYNHVNDCEDDTTGSGSGTPATADTWAHDVGNLTLPHGLCAPSEY